MATEILTEENPFLVPLDEKDHEMQIKSVIKDMVAFVKDLVVNNESSYKKMTSLYRQAREWKKSVESKRKEMVEPLRKQMTIINDKAKDLTDPLDGVIDIANAKANGYMRLLEEAKRKEEESARAVASIFDAEEEIYIPPLEKTLRGEGATLTTKKEKTFRLSDISKVPLKYLMVNEYAIKKDLKLGINEIAGIEVFETTTTQLRMR